MLPSVIPACGCSCVCLGLGSLASFQNDFDFVVFHFCVNLLMQSG